MSTKIISLLLIFLSLLAFLFYFAYNSNAGGFFRTATPTSTNTATPTNTSTPTFTATMTPNLNRDPHFNRRTNADLCSYFNEHSYPATADNKAKG